MYHIGLYLNTLSRRGGQISLPYSDWICTSLNKFTVTRDNVNALTSTLVVNLDEAIPLCTYN